MELPISKLTAGKFALTLDDVLTLDECHQLIERFEAIGFTPAPINGTKIDLTERNCGRAIIDDLEISAMLFNRIKSKIPPIYKNLVPSRLNPRLRCLKYGVGEFFRPHYDGTSRVDGEVSLLTVQFYLSSCQGGETRFLSGEWNRYDSVEVQPHPGRGVIFDHQLYHEGAEVDVGIKYVIRTDILFRSK